MLGWDDLAIAAILLADYLYHRFNDEPPKPAPSFEVTLPRTDDGSPYPLVYGTVRIKAPILAWVDTPISMSAGDLGGITGVADQTIFYFLSMYFVLGVPFRNGTSVLNAMWAGDILLQDTGNGLGSAVPLNQLIGDATDYNHGGSQRNGQVGQPLILNDPLSGWQNFGCVEFRTGADDQVLVDVPYAAESYIGKHMAESFTGANALESLYGNIAAEDIPGYRGFASVFMHGILGGNHWCVGVTSSVPQYSFELSSLPGSWWGPVGYVPVNEGDITRNAGDANPMDVLYDLLAVTEGKLGFDPHYIDTASLSAAALVLYNEGIGYSAVHDGGKTAREIIDGIMRLIDGVIFEDPETGEITVKLIRNDYDPSALMEVNPSNCSSLTNFSSSGWTGIPNKIRVPFKNRAKDYNDDSGVAFDQANALGQNGETREVQVQIDGICELATANFIAARELMARSRPLIKCRVLCDRTFRKIRPGDCVLLNWPEQQISNAVMRVAAVNRGTVADGRVALDLIQDYYYVHQLLPPPHLATGGAKISLGPPVHLSLGGG